MGFEKQLRSVPPAEWVARRAIILDWYDGPRHGVCSLAHPVLEFAFELLDERPNPDDLDDRFFRLKEMKEGSVDAITTLLAELGAPETAIWVPVWRFPSADK